MSVKPRPGSPYYYTRFKIRGRKIYRSTGTTNRREALEFEAALRAKLLKRTPPRGRTNLALLAGHDVALAKANGASPKRQNDILGEWKRIVEYFGPEADPSVFGFDSVSEYVGARRDAGARGQTITREVWAMKRGCKIATRRGWLWEPPEEWPTVRRDPSAEGGKMHSVAVLRCWMAQLSGDAFETAWVLLHTGLRLTSLHALHAKHWRPDASPPCLDFVAPKTKTHRVVPVVDPVTQAILSERAAGRGKLFSGKSHRRAWDTQRKRIWYDHTITALDLRHCFTTWAAEGTLDLSAVQAVRGHTDLRTTQRYLHSGIDRQSKAVLAVAERFFPGSPTGGAGVDQQSAAVALPADLIAQCPDLIEEWSQGADSNRRPADYESLRPSVNLVLGHLSACNRCSALTVRHLRESLNSPEGATQGCLTRPA